MSTRRLSSKLVKHEDIGIVAYSHWCAACRHAHTFYVKAPTGPKWIFVNGDVERPTFASSMREFITDKDTKAQTTLCHYTLTDGVMEYYADAGNAFAGKKLPLEDIPPDYGFSGVAMRDLPE